MNEIKLKTLSCPSCAKPLRNFNGKNLVVKCEFCSNLVVISGDIASNIDVPERIIPFTKSVEEFEALIEQLFIDNDYVPGDIFDNVSFDDVRPIYLPMFLYEGTYHSDWSCELARNDRYATTNSQGNVVQRTRTAWNLYNGSTKSNFAIHGLAYEGDEIPEELIHFTKTFPYEVDMSKAYEPHYLTGFDKLSVLSHNQDKEVIWHKYVLDAINCLVEQNVANQLAESKYRNLNCNMTIESKSDARLTFIPFWFVNFEYNKSKYHVIIDGIGRNTDHLIPQDKIAVAKVHKIDVICGCAVIGAIIIAVITIFIESISTTDWWVIFGSLFCGLIILTGIYGIKKKKIIDGLRELRRQGLKRITDN